MGNYQITTDIFIVDGDRGEKILYAPVQKFACEVNDDMINLLAEIDQIDSAALNPLQKTILDALVERGIVNGHPQESLETSDDSSFNPSKLALFPTNQCNMRCKYCYAASLSATPLIMDWKTAADAIDYFAMHLKKTQRQDFELEFHGGGEPFHAWSLVKHIVQYAEKKSQKEGLNLNVYAGTNGVLSREQLDFIFQHFKSLSVSFEGLPRVQNHQRPMADGSASFDLVDQALQYMDAHHFPYGIRCTVTQFNENLLFETVETILERYKPGLIFMEPVYLCERYKGNSQLAEPDLYQFVENFIELESVCLDKNVRLEYSGAAFDRITRHFCYVGTDNFAVTPDGYLTNCWEVTSARHALADPFIFGRMVNGYPEIDEKKRKHLKTLTVKNIDYCQNCFAKWHCAGDCVVKQGPGNFTGPRGGGRCKTTRLLIKHRIRQLLHSEERFTINPITAS